MRILIGATEISGLIKTWADGFRRLGHQVTTAVIQASEWFPTRYDYDFSKAPFGLERALHAGYLFGTHDIILYQWVRNGFLPDLLDLPYLSMHKKKIVSVMVGSDVRDIPAYCQWYERLRENIKNLPFPKEKLESTLRPMRMAEKYSSLILSQPNQSAIAVRPYRHFFVPLELSDYECHVPGRVRPVIVHSPSRPQLKGTTLFEDTLDQLKREGLDFELIHLRNVTNAKVRETLAQADILLDELNVPLHGKLTLEGMACGCAVVSGNDEEYEPFPPNRPMMSAFTWDLKEKLREVIVNVELRKSLGHSGRAYVETYHDNTKIAEDIIRFFDAPETATYHHYPSFFLTKYQKPADEQITPDLLAFTSEIIRAWGLPAEVDIKDCIQRGLLLPELEHAKDSVQRWEQRAVTSQNSEYHFSTFDNSTRSLLL